MRTFMPDSDLPELITPTITQFRQLSGIGRGILSSPLASTGEAPGGSGLLQSRDDYMRIGQ